MKRVTARGAVASWLVGLALVLGPAYADAPDAGGPAPQQAAEDGDGKADPPSRPYSPRPSAYGTEARDIQVRAPAGAAVVRIPIEGTIDLGLAALVRRALAEHEDAAAVLLDVNTLGGRVDAAIQIRDALLEAHVKTIAFVHPRAISAGALISLACDIIIMTRGGSIGAATPVQLGEGGAQPVEEKMVSYFRTEMRATAEAKGRRGDIAEAMVDPQVAIEGIVSEGKLLTLDTEAALDWRIADARADSVEEVLRAVGLAGAPRELVDENWAEKLVRFLTDPVVSGLLMSLGTLGILIELYTPGVGIPGALGVLCLGLFFGGHLLVNLAGLEELLLLVAGLGLLALELFVVPGFGVTGIFGIVCIFAALVLTLIGVPLTVAFTTSLWVEPLLRVTAALVITTGLMIVALRYLPRTRAGRGLVLETGAGREQGFVASDNRRFLQREGVAESDLRPVGVARFGDERVDVVSEGGYLARGSRVKVTMVEGARIVVRAIEEGPQAG